MADVRELLPDYVLGLLEAEDQMAVEKAIEASPALQAELEELRATVFRLPDRLKPIAPPPSAWSQIQTRIHPKPNWMRWGAAAAVLALLLLGGWGFQQYQTNRHLQTEQYQIAEWVAIPKAHWRSFGTDKTYGTMIWKDGDCYMVMIEPPPKGKAYQAWGRKDDDIPISLGVFRGRTFQTKYDGYKSVGVSLEPLGGSAKPSHPLGQVSTEKEKSQNAGSMRAVLPKQIYLSELKALLGPSGTNPYCV